MADVSGKSRGSNGTLALATGHNAPDEVLLMVEEARRLDLQVVVTHPLLESVGMSVEQMKRAAEMGAYLEFVSGFTRQPETIREYAEAIREIGPAYGILSSDRGQGAGPEGDEAQRPTHVEGLLSAVEALRANGFTERELDMMLKESSKSNIKAGIGMTMKTKIPTTAIAIFLNFTATAAKYAPGKAVKAVSNQVEIEIVAKSDEEADK